MDASKWTSQIRTYVDDITISTTGPNPRVVVRPLGHGLPKLKALLLSKNMVTNMSKEQTYSPTKKVLDLWHKARPRYGGALAHKAKDLGVAQRGLNVRSHIRQKRLQEFKGKAQRVKSLRGGKRPKVLICRASLQPSTFYACEVDPLTLQDIHKTRMGVAVGLNLDWGPRSKTASMLFSANGLLDPKAYYYFRVHWPKRPCL